MSGRGVSLLRTVTLATRCTTEQLSLMPDPFTEQLARFQQSLMSVHKKSLSYEAF